MPKVKPIPRYKKGQTVREIKIVEYYGHIQLENRKQREHCYLVGCLKDGERYTMTQQYIVGYEKGHKSSGCPVCQKGRRRKPANITVEDISEDIRQVAQMAWQ